MKRLLFFCLILFALPNVYAKPFEHLVFFGDSLSDNGNLYHQAFKLLPKSPPYYKGRFTNGRTWTEQVGDYYYNKYYIDYKIYAFGGATAMYHTPNGKMLPPFVMLTQLDKYILDTLFQDRSKTLAMVWIGGNDYLFDDEGDPDQATQLVVNSIIASLTKLYNAGIRMFYVVNLPDLSKIPFAHKYNAVHLGLLSHLHNEKLAIKIHMFMNDHPDVKLNLFDAEQMFDDVLKAPEIFNQKYGSHITDVTTACWQGGLWWKQTAKNQGKLSELERYIFGNPLLTHTYTLAQSYGDGNVPCSNANEHIFWDEIHPSETVHTIFTKMVIESMNKVIQV